MVSPTGWSGAWRRADATSKTDLVGHNQATTACKATTQRLGLEVQKYRESRVVTRAIWATDEQFTGFSTVFDFDLWIKPLDLVSGSAALAVEAPEMSGFQPC
jgi:hypothetical protein